MTMMKLLSPSDGKGYILAPKRRIFLRGQKWSKMSKKVLLSKNITLPIKLISGMCEDVFDGG